MTDRMTAEQRHNCMSRIRAEDTKPEMIVRRWLWQHGFRYRLHVSRLPGTPDIVMRKHKTAIFINGCFWHGHNCPHGNGLAIVDSECCKIPKSNRGFWVEKIRRNMRRDEENIATLQGKGWHVITIWECELRPKQRDLTLEKLLERLNAIMSKPKGYLTPDETIEIAADPETPYYSPRRPLDY